jgi:AraC-like DNA-binding protein
MNLRGTRALNVYHQAKPHRHLLLRLGAAAFIPELFDEQGLSTEAALARGGFTRRWFSQLQPVVPLSRLGLTFKAAAAATAQAEFGLLVGLRAGSRLMDGGRGPSGAADTNVGSALLRMIARPAVFPNVFLSLTVCGTTCAIGCSPLSTTVPAREQLTECAMGFAAGTLRALCGPQWRARGFHFAHAPPPDPLRHAALLQAPVEFDKAATAMTFDAEWLGRETVRNAGGTPGDVLLQQPDDDFAARVRAFLASRDLAGRPSAPEVASALGLHPRTLNRLLGKTGTGFNRMLGDARYETAQRMLRDPAIPVISIAWSLGYADASAFSRAFRRWSGMTPSGWRKSSGREAPGSAQ